MHNNNRTAEGARITDFQKNPKRSATTENAEITPENTETTTENTEPSVKTAENKFWLD